jgi:ribosomal protein S18 acetylase RimI-like enzyme
MQKYITNSTIEDINTIFSLYDAAVTYQKTVFNKQWEGFERSLIETEIKENRQWKMLIDGEVACIFVLTFNDALFWKEKDKQPSIYIHRIVTNPKFRGGYFVNDIIIWAKAYCKANQKDFIRLDTWGDNPKLIAYYVKCGFTFLEIIDLDNTEGLPKHYKGTLALFEMVV